MGKKDHPLIILGSGPAGYTAAIYAARANIPAALITGLNQGGQLMTTTAIENWPGGAENLQGPELMSQMLEHLNRYQQITVIQDHIKASDLSKRPFELTGDSTTYSAQALIIATGASPRFLGLPSEKEYFGKGVSTCATCDGFFYKNQKVAVIGGGNTAVEEALYLSNIAKEVTLVHRRDQLRADKILAEQLKEKKNIHIEWNSLLNQVIGNENQVSAIELKDVKSEEIKKIDMDGVFIAIGHIPNTQLFEGQIEMEGGYIKTQSGQNGNATAASIKGIFAAGDVADPIYRQAITSSGSGCMAALDAQKYLEELKSSNNQTI